MEAQGLTSLFPMRDLAVMGLVEVLPRLRSLSVRLNEAVEDIAARKPDMVITIDSPGFALRLLRRIADKDFARALRGTAGVGLAAETRKGISRSVG